MKKIYFSALCLFLSTGQLISQIGIGTASPVQSSILEMASANKGFLITRVPLVSRTDIATVANPSLGMLVLASQNSGSGENAIYEGRMYKFNGTAWDEMVEEGEIASGSLFPELVAVGRKTANTTCTNTTMGNFQLTTLNNIKTTINANGSIQAYKTGYYIWSVSLRQFMLQSAYSPFLLPGMLNYSFKDGNTTTTRAWQTTVFTGSVYLQQGDISEPFQWHLGGTCVAQDLIGPQLVTWQYIGQ